MNMRGVTKKDPVKQEVVRGTEEKGSNNSVVAVTRKPLLRTAEEYEPCKQIAQVIANELGESKVADPIIGMVCTQSKSGKKLFVTLSGQIAKEKFFNKIMKNPEWQKRLADWEKIVGEICFVPAPAATNQFGYGTPRSSMDFYNIDVVANRDAIEWRSYGIVEKSGVLTLYYKKNKDGEPFKIDLKDKSGLLKNFLQAKQQNSYAEIEKIKQQIVAKINENQEHVHNTYCCCEPTLADALMKESEANENLTIIGEIYHRPTEAYQHIKLLYSREFEEKINNLKEDTIGLTIVYNKSGEPQKIQVAAWEFVDGEIKLTRGSFNVDVSNTDHQWLLDVYTNGFNKKNPENETIQRIINNLSERNPIVIQKNNGSLNTIGSCRECQHRANLGVYNEPQKIPGSGFTTNDVQPDQTASNNGTRINDAQQDEVDPNNQNLSELASNLSELNVSTDESKAKNYSLEADPEAEKPKVIARSKSDALESVKTNKNPDSVNSENQDVSQNISTDESKAKNNSIEKNTGTKKPKGITRTQSAAFWSAKRDPQAGSEKSKNKDVSQNPKPSH